MMLAAGFFALFWGFVFSAVKFADEVMSQGRKDSIKRVGLDLWERMARRKAYVQKVWGASAQFITFGEIGIYLAFGVLVASLFFMSYYYSLTPSSAAIFKQDILKPTLFNTVALATLPLPSLIRVRTRYQYFLWSDLALGVLIIVSIILFAGATVFGQYAALGKWKIQEFVLLSGMCSWIIIYSGRVVSLFQYVLVYAAIGGLVTAEFVVRLVAHAPKGALGAVVALAGLIGSIAALCALALQSV